MKAGRSRNISRAPTCRPSQQFGPCPVRPRASFSWGNWETHYLLSHQRQRRVQGEHRVEEDRDQRHVETTGMKVIERKSQKPSMSENKSKKKFSSTHWPAEPEIWAQPSAPKDQFFLGKLANPILTTPSTQRPAPRSTASYVETFRMKVALHVETLRMKISVPHVETFCMRVSRTTDANDRRSKASVRGRKAAGLCEATSP